MCDRCHDGDPGGEGRRRFRRDVVSLCLDCHLEKDLSSLHPVDIRPEGRVPEGLPLDSQGTVTCATCHDPHASPTADEPYVAESIGSRLLSALTGRKRYPTFFLRRRNNEGQLCLACHEKAGLAAEGFHVVEQSIRDRYVGSRSCGRCHGDVYRAWSATPHARMVRDVREDPAAVLADFETEPPFDRSEVLYALGSHWTQRFVVRKQGKLVVKAPIWSIPQKAWDTSYWIDKPWIQYCAGCHTTGFEMGQTAAWAELGVGCEACHGPGRSHSESGGAAPVVNPARLDRVRRDMICESCHTTGHDRTGQFRFPLGYLPGRDLTRYFKGLLPKPGQDNETFDGDGSYRDRHRQWEFWVEHFLDARGLTCDVCKNFRSTLDPGDKPRMTPTRYCLTCHDTTRAEPALHEVHLAAAVDCRKCHEPRVASDGGYSVHDHKFLFGPAEGSGRPPRETCGGCHGDASARSP